MTCASGRAGKWTGLHGRHRIVYGKIAELMAGINWTNNFGGRNIKPAGRKHPYKDICCGVRLRRQMYQRFHLGKPL